MRTLTLAAATLAAALVAILAVPALADRHACAPRGEVVALLEKSYAETLVFRGLAATGRMIELFMSPEGDWTITATQPQLPGWSCVIGNGTGGQVPPVKKTGPI